MYTTRIQLLSSSFIFGSMAHKVLSSGIARVSRRMNSKSVSITRSGETTGPIEELIIEKLRCLSPTRLIIKNDSHKHSHHQPMQNATNVRESHFKVEIISDNFIGKSLAARHRLVYSLLTEEFNEKGLHALQMTTRTSKEDGERRSR